jgi:phage shock protein C
MTLGSVTSIPERDHRRLTKSATGRKVAGVCSGLARYFDTDATLVRLIFAGLTLLGGSGVVIYVLAWMIMPAASSIDDMLGQLRRLGELKDAGVLTEAEFQTQKAKILAD